MRTVSAAILLLALSATALHAEEGMLSGAEIKAKYSDWRNYGKTPSGKVFLVIYGADGSMKGVVSKGQDTGTWWVEGDTLCRKWNAWAGRKPEECFSIKLDGTKVHWFRADGSLYRTWKTQ